MNVTLAPRTGLQLRSPVIAASGTFGYGTEFAERQDLTGLGAIVCKGTTREPRAGNPPIRMVETSAGTLNAIGLQNIGVEAVVREKAPIWAGWDIPVFVNVSGNTIEDYRYVVSCLDGVPGVAGIELNISCPNVKEGGIAFGADPRLASHVTAAAREASGLPLLVKLSPNVSDIRLVARAVEDAGADAISLINTVYGMTIDRRRRTPQLANGSGGLSGPAIKPLALYLVYQVAQEVSVPIVGMGGILSWEDAAEFLLAGATAIGLATALLVDPTSPRAVSAGLDAWLEDQHLPDAMQVVGSANPDFKKKAGEAHFAGSR
jgi:dihydroorotate dehydrogenase (NAD+) catalytic subunit